MGEIWQGNAAAREAINSRIFDPRVAVFDPRVKLLDPRVASLDPRVKLLDPRVGSVLF